MALLQGTDTVDTMIGTPENDLISGLNGSDFVKGFDGNDSLFGHEGGDVMEGGSGNDDLFGGQGDDILVSGEGSDLIAGDAGVDIIVGVSLQSANPGSGEVDQLLGGAGSDFFYLGNQFQPFYQGAGSADLAVITDYNPLEDFIMVHGDTSVSVADITLDQFGSGVGVFVPGLTGENELIGFLAGLSSTQLNLQANLLKLSA